MSFVITLEDLLLLELANQSTSVILSTLKLLRALQRLMEPSDLELTVHQRRRPKGGNGF